MDANEGLVLRVEMETVFRATMNKLSISGISGLTVDAYIYQGNNIWNGYYFAAFNSAPWADFAIPMSEQVPSGFYECLFPKLIPPGVNYFVVFKQRNGEEPNPSDFTIYQGPVNWNGCSLESTGTVLGG